MPRVTDALVALGCFAGISHIQAVFCLAAFRAMQYLLATSRAMCYL